jgi:glucosyl-dolichyl phosphate glucuronosyltransferase
MTTSPNTFLSVIVPTRNRRALLEKALRSFAAQDLPIDRFEIIVVDNGSTDDTSAAVAALAKQAANLRLISEPRPGLHRGRHAGLRAARGDILVYADDDVYALPSWLSAIARSFEDSAVMLVGGKTLPEYEISPPHWVESLWRTTTFGRYLSLFSVLDFGDRVARVPARYVFGCNFSIRRSALLAVGGFHPDGMPADLLRFRGDGETAVANAIDERDWVTLYNPAAAVRHWVSAQRMTPRYVYERRFAQGISDSYAHARSARTNGTHWPFLARLVARFASTQVRALVGDRSGIERAQEKGYRHGYWFHQRALRDPALLAWVLKPHYLDD